MALNAIIKANIFFEIKSKNKNKKQKTFITHLRNPNPHPCTLIGCIHGNLRGEFVAAAILGVAYGAELLYLQIIFISFPCGLNHTCILIIAWWITWKWLCAHIVLNDCAKSEGTITHLCMWQAIWQPLHSINTGVKKRLDSPLKFPCIK